MSAPESQSFKLFAVARIRQANTFGHDLVRDDYDAGPPEYGHWTCAHCGANLNVRTLDNGLPEASYTSGIYEKCRGRR